ncbi:hypothetical protein RD1_0617 [Roseobacter denitrificans OCh 114]|uniref:Uncharacterized protein n=1 Tax=Roseobacter denitrificans (strain ATCC 33942 / OCh 114) TaxID=375451 RepID=Q16CH6_ROSDO|nr:hypothetical protein RD1_0617 [Roseobacter denitrificans OCh 114]
MQFPRLDEARISRYRFDAMKQLFDISDHARLPGRFVCLIRAAKAHLHA